MIKMEKSRKKLLKVILSIIIILLLIFLFLKFYNYSMRSADTIIVLGYNLNAQDSNETIQSRVLNGLRLCNNETKFIILTGGSYFTNPVGIRILNESNNRTEAREMKNVWMKNNKNCSAEIILEENSTITLSNAFNSLKVMRENDLRYALVISSSYHWYAYPYFYLAKLFSFSKVKLSINLYA